MGSWLNAAFLGLVCGAVLRLGVGLRGWVFSLWKPGRGFFFFEGPRVCGLVHHILLFRLEGIRPVGVWRLCGAWPCVAVLVWLVLASGCLG